MLYIFGKPLKNTIRLHMFEAQRSKGVKVMPRGRKTVRDFGPCQGPPRLDFDPNWGQVTRVPPQDQAIRTGANQGPEWSNRRHGRLAVGWGSWVSVGRLGVSCGDSASVVPPTDAGGPRFQGGSRVKT